LKYFFVVKAQAVKIQTRRSLTYFFSARWTERSCWCCSYK